MNLNFSPEEISFQNQIREFLANNLPKETSTKLRSGKILSKEEMMNWHIILNKRGWLATSWPKEFGGPGWNAVQKYIFEEECCRAYAPRIVPFGIHMLGPVVQKFGSDRQKKEILPRILSCEDWWCQGYSEPGAGSDLASLKTRAVKIKNNYIVNGQKTWTTLGQYANKIFCLVRTSKEKKQQEGISFLLIGLDTPGVEMRPIRLIDGGWEVNEVFFKDVKVPIRNLVGEEGKGWSIAKFLLNYERTGIAGVGFSIQALEEVKVLAKSIKRGSKRLIDDPLFSARLAKVEINLEALKITNLRMLLRSKDQILPGAEASMLKIVGTEINKELRDLARRALGPLAAPLPGYIGQGNILFGPENTSYNSTKYFNNLKTSIFGGSNEIQRNILAKTVLEL